MSKTLKIGVGVIALALVLDQITKYLVKTTMTLGEKITVIPGFFTITSHRNTGAAWGIFSGNMPLFYGITVLALVLFFFLLKDADITKKPLYSVAIYLMI